MATKIQTSQECTSQRIVEELNLLLRDFTQTKAGQTVEIDDLPLSNESLDAVLTLESAGHRRQLSLHLILSSIIHNECWFGLLGFDPMSRKEAESQVVLLG